MYLFFTVPFTAARYVVNMKQYNGMKQSVITIIIIYTAMYLMELLLQYNEILLLYSTVQCLLS